MWNGYLDSKKTAFNESLYNFLKPYEIEYMHTSGHADLETLKTVFETVKPRGGIIPIHTDAPEKFQELFQEQTTIIPLLDGQIFNVK
jgi:ribonuclease J